MKNRIFLKKRQKKNQKINSSEGNSSNSKEFILLAACGDQELLPMNPNLPADIFTACLTTPIMMSIKW